MPYVIKAGKLAKKLWQIKSDLPNSPKFFTAKVFTVQYKIIVAINMPPNILRGLSSTYFLPFLYA